jgi:hypothetical protein
MKITEADVVWVPVTSGQRNAGDIRVERHMSGWKRTPGDRWIRADAALTTNGLSPAKMTGDLPTNAVFSLFVLFNTVVVRDGIDPLSAHKAMLAIDEYRQTISPDTPSAS